MIAIAASESQHVLRLNPTFDSSCPPFAEAIPNPLPIQIFNALRIFLRDTELLGSIDLSGREMRIDSEYAKEKEFPHRCVSESKV